MALGLACVPWLALLGWMTALTWFLTDDAFISFRYVRNLLEGHGLVFNPGERVEGYSNFLWILELAAIWRVGGVEPEVASRWLSVVCTVGTLGTLLWWMAHQPAVGHRGLVIWMALGLVCSSATFAVWTSGGGLETRQFSLFVVVAVVCLGLYRHHPAGLLAASLSLAGAALTRPEGPLLALCCFGWFLGQRMAVAGREGLHREGRRALLCLVGPCVALVGAHFLFRYAYYGEWLPNTYHAKHVRAWYESGFRYLWAAALETGLYLWLPLAYMAARAQWRQHRDGTFALGLGLVGTHMAYVMHMGGDHFEYRPLDFYWPLLAFPAATGLAGLAARIVTRDPGRPRAPFRRWGGSVDTGARAMMLMLFAPVWFYASALQGLLLYEGSRIHEYIPRLHIELDHANARWLRVAPGMPMLTAVSNDLRRLMAVHKVASPFTLHRAFANQQIRRWKPYYVHMERGVMPDDALMAGGALGIRFYYLPDLAVIDLHGLTDATIARHPVTIPNHQRAMAHDRSPPAGYLEARGVNFTVYPAAASASAALRRAEYALPVGPDLWMPFDAPERQWVLDRFARQNLVTYICLTGPPDPAAGSAWGVDCAPEDRIVWAGADAWRSRLLRDRRPVIQSAWDVYHLGDRLVYVREPCGPADVAASPFFLHVVPVHPQDLPVPRRSYGFDNLDFHFPQYGVMFRGWCLAEVPLPAYRIRSLRTGQYVRREDSFQHVWEGEFRHVP